MLLAFEKVEAYVSPYVRQDVIQLVKRRRSVILSVCVFFFFILLLQLRSAHSDPSRDALSKSRGTPDPLWQYPRDAKNYRLTGEECSKVFPGLFVDVDRAIRDRNGARITLEELESIPKRNGYVRAMIYDQEVSLLHSPSDPIDSH